ncbi:hypothetical protein SAMN05421819_2874 [Bryocella elongata]|uniref:Uncharacterized protein n=1 Tax=Bryocella elongata TaxID=863522 RepID=A0A1H6A2X5_9BACT|nr:hypothetical protein [Bryocella elongata]SEG42712.1 hypothetical protein SAMN05421819_2874 [Bryocella elongata]
MLATADSSSRPIAVPLQANLRRAISAGYYAVFHLLIAEAVGRLLPTAPPTLTARVSRAFEHREMKKVCDWFVKPQLPDQLRDLLPGGVSPELNRVAKNFLQLQEARHRADYDLQFPLDRQIALARVKEAEDLFRTWNNVRDEEDSRIFLTALAFGGRWSK